MLSYSCSSPLTRLQKQHKSNKLVHNYSLSLVTFWQIGRHQQTSAPLCTGCAFVKLQQGIKSVTEAEKGSNHINHKSWKKAHNAVHITVKLNQVNKDPIFTCVTPLPKTCLHLKEKCYQCNLKAC